MLPALRRGARGTRRRRTAALPTPPTRRRLSTPCFQLGRLNHVALAVPDLAAATATWAALGATVSPPQAMPAHGVTACFVGEQLELLEPLGAESPIAAFLERRSFPKLETLSLRGAGLRAMPDAVLRLSRLRELDLSRNELLRALPDDLAALESLDNINEGIGLR